MLAERFRTHIETETVPAGVATLQPNDASIEDILKRADKALYAAKNKGRNCTTVG